MHRPGTGEWIAIAAVLLLGGVLRCAFPSNAAVEHFDEGVYASNVWFGGQAPGHYPMREMYAPPLLPTLVEWLMLLFGSAAPVPMLVNLAAGTLTIVVLWWAGRTWFGVAAGITAAALCAFSDFHIVYSRTALTDPLLLPWLIAALFCLGEGHRRLSVAQASPLVPGAGDGDDRCKRGRLHYGNHNAWRWFLAGGVLTGLAWWTKYNGWLPLAIQFAGVCGWLLLGRGSRVTGCGPDVRTVGPSGGPLVRTSDGPNVPSIGWHLGGIVLTAAVAGVVIAPMFLGLNDVGGYAAVAENHRGYLVGWDGWWDGVQRHVGAQRFLEGYVSVIGTAYAVLWGLLFSVRRARGGFTWNRSGGRAPLLVLLAAVGLACGLAAAFGTVVVVGVFALGGLVRGLWAVRNGKPPCDVGWWLMAAWFVGLLVATPLYRAYPRLALPWLASAWLGAGAALQRMVDLWQRRAAEDDGDVNSRALPVAVCLLLLGGLLFYAGLDRFPTVRVPGWQNRGGFRPIAEEITKLADGDAAKAEPAATGSSAIRVDDGPKFVVYVYGEPGLFFHLNRTQREPGSPSFVVAVAPVAVGRIVPVTSGSTTIPTYLVAGPHADRDEAFQQELERSAGRFRQVGGTLRYRASDLVLLNEQPASEAADPDRRPRFAVRLFRVK